MRCADGEYENLLKAELRQDRNPHIVWPRSSKRQLNLADESFSMDAHRILKL